MNEPRQVAKKLRDVSQEGNDPAARRLAMLHLLRKEFDDLPVDAAIALLAQVRAEVSPGDEGSEAYHLWECVSGEAPAPSQHRAASGPADTVETQVREVLGQEAVPAGGLSPESADRWNGIVKFVFGSLLQYEKEFQRLYRTLKRDATPSADHTTSLGIQMERPLKEVLVEILEGRREFDELERRYKRFALAAWSMYNAHLASSNSSRESLRKLLDPNLIQKTAAGKDYWTHYRQLYRQELYDLGPTFSTIFVEEPFLSTFIKAMKKP